MTNHAAKRGPGRPGTSKPLLLEAAIQEFAEKGYAGATTAGIAKRARANQPLIHHHFGSKERLFRAVIDTLFARMQDEVLTAADGDVPSLVRRLVMHTARHPELARIWVVESAQRGRHLGYLVEHHIEPLVEYVRPVIERWSAEERSEKRKGKSDPRMLFYATLGLASFPFLVSEQVRKAAGRSPLTTEYAEKYADVVIGILFGRDREC